MGVPLRHFSAHAGRVSSYREFAGSVPAVACTWEGVPGWERALRVLPDGCVDLAWDGRELRVITGFAPARIRVPASGTSVGLRLRCGTAGGLLGPGFAAPASVVGSLASAASPAAQRVVLERFVARRLRHGFVPDPAATAAVLALASGARVDVVADRLGLAVRTLRRRVHAAAGCGPKELQRVLRFRGFLRHLDDLASGRTGLASVAAAVGYADQSHLGHECLRLSGSSPARLVAGYARHARVAEIDQTPPA